MPEEPEVPDVPVLPDVPDVPACAIIAHWAGEVFGVFPILLLINETYDVPFR